MNTIDSATQQTQPTAQQPSVPVQTQPVASSQDQQNSNKNIENLIVTIATAQISDEAKMSIFQLLSDERYDVNAIQQQINQVSEQEKAKAQQSVGTQAAQVAESLSEQMELYIEAYKNAGDDWDLIQETGFWGNLKGKASDYAQKGYNVAKNSYTTVRDAAKEFNDNRQEKNNNEYYYQINQEIRGITRAVAELVADLQTTGINLSSHPEIQRQIDQIIASQNDLINNTGAKMGAIQKLRYGAGKYIAGSVYNAATFYLINQILPSLGFPIVRRSVAGVAASILRDARTGKFYKQPTDKDGNPIPGSKDVIDWYGIAIRALKGAGIGAATAAAQKIFGLEPQSNSGSTSDAQNDVPAGSAASDLDPEVAKIQKAGETMKAAQGGADISMGDYDLDDTSIAKSVANALQNTEDYDWSDDFAIHRLSVDPDSRLNNVPLKDFKFGQWKDIGGAKFKDAFGRSYEDIYRNHVLAVLKDEGISDQDLMTCRDGITMVMRSVPTADKANDIIQHLGPEGLLKLGKSIKIDF